MSKVSQHSTLGRPALSPSERCGVRVVTMVTKQEHDALKSLAEQSGLSISALCRALLRRSIDTAKPNEYKKQKSNRREQ